MAGFADTFDTHTRGDFVGLDAFSGSVVMVVATGYLTDQPSKFRRKSDGAMLCDVAKVDIITVLASSDDVPKEAKDVQLRGVQPTGAVRFQGQAAQAGRSVKPLLKLVDVRKSDDGQKDVYGLVDVSPERGEIVALIPGHRDMTVSQIERAAVDLVGKIQEKAYAEWLDYSKAKAAGRQEAARQMFEEVPAPARFENRPHVTDDPWASVPADQIPF